MIKPTTRLTFGRTLNNIEFEADNKDDLQHLICVYRDRANKLEAKLAALPPEQPKQKGKIVPYGGGIMYV